MRIAVAGTGYVGLSLAVLLAQHNQVRAVDVIPEKVELLNQGRSPIKDGLLQDYLGSHKLDLSATLDGPAAYKEAELVLVSTPTDYDPERNYFNTSSVEEVIGLVRRLNPAAYIVVKSTVPIGFTERMQQRFATDHILFSPEFLREGRALYDNLYPSRIIVGVKEEQQEALAAARRFAGLLQEGALKQEVPVLLMEPTEAEAVKLFANTYLAMRVAFFNELDTYAASKNLDPAAIIKGVGLDPRVGDDYHNPSFGYGGYCFPKDTKQLLADYGGIPQRLIRATVEANAVRKEFIAASALAKAGLAARQAAGEPCNIGIYRLIMKSGSDNFRQAAVMDIIGLLRKAGARVSIYEPTLAADSYLDCPVIHDLAGFKEANCVILANRPTAELADVADKVYSRDLFATE